jgi:hypothetical protein
MMPSSGDPHSGGPVQCTAPVPLVYRFLYQRFACRINVLSTLSTVWYRLAQAPTRVRVRARARARVRAPHTCMICVPLYHYPIYIIYIRGWSGTASGTRAVQAVPLWHRRGCARRCATSIPPAVTGCCRRARHPAAAFLPASSCGQTRRFLTLSLRNGALTPRKQPLTGAAEGGVVDADHVPAPARSRFSASVSSSATGADASMGGALANRASQGVGGFRSRPTCRQQPHWPLAQIFGGRKIRNIFFRRRSLGRVGLGVSARALPIGSAGRTPGR